ncbi:MAG: hypothetical protein JKY65_16805 [Planctomycetes bacterium]|nr:hypothetical protein [Planctomycetota bacterium]
MARKSKAVVFNYNPKSKQNVAGQLNALLETWEKQGWTYSRMEQVPVFEPAGCLAAMFGANGVSDTISVAIFQSG